MFSLLSASLSSVKFLFFLSSPVLIISFTVLIF